MVAPVRRTWFGNRERTADFPGKVIADLGVAGVSYILERSTDLASLPVFDCWPPSPWSARHDDLHGY